MIIDIKLRGMYMKKWSEVFVFFFIAISMLIVFALTFYFLLKSSNLFFILFIIPNTFLLFYSCIALKFFLTNDYLDYKIDPSLFYECLNSKENATR